MSRSGIAGTTDFIAPDEGRARSLAGTLSGYGFPLVTARPEGSKWLVTAYDEGPYPQSVLGNRTIDAVARAAAVLARGLGAYPSGGCRCDPSILYGLRVSAPIVVENPGARPPAPALTLSTPPPRVHLAMTPDPVRNLEVDLRGLDDIDWPRLQHAFGGADDVPRLIASLARNHEDWSAVLGELLGDNLLHQGSCYPATAPAVPFLVRILASGSVSASRRLDLYGWLLTAATCWASDLIVSWNENLDPGWLESPGVSSSLRAGQILAEGALGAM